MTRKEEKGGRETLLKTGKGGGGSSGSDPKHNKDKRANVNWGTIQTDALRKRPKVWRQQRRF